jgi:hypothetical protein
LVDSIHNKIPLVLFVGTKAMDQEAGIAIKIPKIVDPPAIIIEFHKNFM